MIIDRTETSLVAIATHVEEGNIFSKRIVFTFFPGFVEVTESDLKEKAKESYIVPNEVMGEIGSCLRF